MGKGVNAGVAQDVAEISVIEVGIAWGKDKLALGKCRVYSIENKNFLPQERIKPKSNLWKSQDPIYEIYATRYMRN
jgi:hypothetical protein